MLTEEESMEISILLKQGFSLREISKKTGYSVNTVRKYKAGQKPSYKQRHVRKPTKLSHYEVYIQERLEAVSPHWIPATVIFREIEALGYTGKIRQLRYFMAKLKPNTSVEPIIRFETPAGNQLQVDWAHFSYMGEKIYAFIAVLGYSRMAFVRFTKDMKIETLLECHQQAFEYFGGVPKYCLYDNMKTVVIKRNAYGSGQHRLHAKLYDFAKHYGFMPKLCLPYRAKTKGKVERFVSYLRYSFFTPLIGRLKMAKLCLDLDTVNTEVNYWLEEVANCRIHNTINQQPIARFAREKLHLQSLPRYSYCLPTPEPCSHNIQKPWPIENMQHDIKIYDAIVGANL